MDNAIWVYKDECFDVGGGGATVSVHRSLDEAMCVYNSPTFTYGDKQCPGRWAEAEKGRWVVEYNIPEMGWTKESDLTYSNRQSITQCEFGDQV